MLHSVFSLFNQEKSFWGSEYNEYYESFYKPVYFENGRTIAFAMERAFHFWSYLCKLSNKNAASAFIDLLNPFGQQRLLITDLLLALRVVEKCGREFNEYGNHGCVSRHLP